MGVPARAGDGVPDDEDCNPMSDLRPTIIVGTIDTGVAALTNAWMKAGHITGAQKGAIESAAARKRS